MNNKYVFVGFKDGKINVMEFNGTLKEVLENGKENKGVSSMCANDEYLVSGLENGSMCVYDLGIKKEISSSVKVHDGAITCIKIMLGPKFEVITLGKDKVLKCSLIKISRKNTMIEATVSTEVILRDRTIHSICPIPFPTPLVAISDSNTVLLLDPKRDKKILDKYNFHVPQMGRTSCLAFNKVTTTARPKRETKVLAVACGTSVTILGLHEDSLRIISHHCELQEINYIGWIEDNHLIILEDNKTLSLLYIDNIISTTLRNDKSRNFKLCSYKLPCEELNIEGRYSQCLSSKKHYIVCLEKESMIIGRMNSWFDFLNNMAANKKSYEDIIKMTFKINIGEVKGFASLSEGTKEREEDLKEWIKDHVGKHFFLMSELKEEEIINDLKLAAQIFILVLNQKRFIIENLRKYFEKAKMMNSFIKVLEPYIMSGCFKHEEVPNEFISSVINYYEEMKEYMLMENAIILLASPKNDFSYLCMICQQYNLHTGFIFLCTFIDDSASCNNPLIIMWDALNKGNLSKEDFELKDFQVVIPKTILNSAKYLKYKILWYIDLCLKGITYSLGRIKKYNFENVTSVLSFVMKKNILKELIKLDPKATFNEVLVQVFIEDDLRVLFENPSSSTFNLEYILREISKIVESLNDVNVFEQFVLFRSNALAAPGVPIIPELAFIEARLLSQYSGLKPSTELMVLSHLRQLGEISSEVIKELKVLFKDTEYIEMKELIMRERKEYVELLDLYIKYKPHKVFHWLEGISAQIQSKEFKEAIIERIEQLVFYYCDY